MKKIVQTGSEAILSLNELTAISPMDGRYGSKTSKLRAYFSEYALFKYRVKMELLYFKALCYTLPQLADFDRKYFRKFDSLVRHFSVADAMAIKDIERTTDHDVKAVEYWLADVFEKWGIGRYKTFIHFGLTSNDINSTAQNSMIMDGLRDVIMPELRQLIMFLNGLCKDWWKIVMLSHTHGQPASPTTLGKEIYVFVERLGILYDELMVYQFEAKFGGATGNFNAHLVAYPQIDWPRWADKFLRDKLGLVRQQHTTQLEHNDNLARLFDILKRINTVFIDLDRDMWAYISMEYFSQRVKKEETGSSVMPHKVNPIYFENSEGNAGLAIAMFEYLSAKLPISRLQRDLTDSTGMRNVGVLFAHTLLAIQSAYRGFTRVYPNQKKLSEDLDANWVVVSEAIQTILRREMYPEDPYGVLKRLTRQEDKGKITKEVIHAFIDALDVLDSVKKELKLITPHNYYGVC